MQANRRPSQWPFVGILIGLLILCLTVPRYWSSAQRPQEPAASSNASAANDAPPSAKRTPTAAAFHADRALVLASPVLAELAGRPSLDELVASAISDTQLKIRTVPFRGRPLDERQLLSTSRTAVSFAKLEPWAAGASERAGQALAEYSLHNARGWCARIGECYARWSANRPSSPISAIVANVDVERVAEVVGGPWCPPVTLLDCLERLAEHPYTFYWATDTISQLNALTQSDPNHHKDAESLIGQLRQAADEAIRLADGAPDDRLSTELLRAHWGLVRRLDQWQPMQEIRVAAIANARFASRGSLHAMLDDWTVAAAEVKQLRALSEALETHEQSRQPQTAREVIVAQRELVNEGDETARQLADAVEDHYRNANIRVAITSELLNRVVRHDGAEMDVVRDCIAGTPVRGQSETQATTTVRLEPAEGRWHLELQSQGVVYSDTLADGGQAVVRSAGATDFSARKAVVVDPSGVQYQPAVVLVDNHSVPLGVSSSVDWVPLMGSFVRDRALDQYRAKRPQARAEVEAKVARQTMQRLSGEVVRHIERLQREVETKVTTPLAGQGITLTPIELTTTSERMVARLRLAGEYQLGGHTPRPRALSDSLVSLQIHESALTSMAMILALDGERLSAAELQAKLREQFPHMAQTDADDAPDDTIFQFAHQGAVRLNIEGDRAELSISFDDYQHEGRRIRGFVVHAFYVPVIDGLGVELVRDGPLGIEGRISATDRAHLHNAFDEVLSAERRLTLLRADTLEGEEWDGLMITQLVMEDGWLGMAIGPATNGRITERTRSLR